MPEHDTFDLDAAFSRLEHDVAGISSPRGAGAAIATARRRRRTTIGAVAAVAVLVLGAAAVGQGIAGRDTSIGPAQLPPPAPFDASSLSAATRGWVSDWGAPTKPDQISFQGSAAPRCLGAMADDFDKPATPGPVGAGGGVLVSQGGAAALTTLAEWGADHPDASTVGYAAVVASIDACGQASPDRRYTWDGGEGRSWTISSGDQTQHIWVARTARAVGVLWTGGSAGPVPDDVDQQVSIALVAGLESPKSFNPIPTSTSTSGSSRSGSSLSTVSDEHFARALAGWDNAWRQQGDPQSDGQLPCVRNWEGTATSAAGASLGANGDQGYADYGSVQEARAAMDEIQRSFASCAGSSYRISTPSGGADSSLLVATGPEVVWVAQEGTTVGTIAIPGGTTAPPAQVTSSVTTLMIAAMSRQPKVESPAPEQSGN